MKVWGKLIRKNKLLQDHTVEIYDNSLSRTKKVYQALHDICYEFDLATPIWLKSNEKDFLCHAKTRFTKDNFIEYIEFDYLEFQVIEEDY